MLLKNSSLIRFTRIWICFQKPANERFPVYACFTSITGKPETKLVNLIFEKYFSEISMAMINLVIKNKRELYLPGIARNFGDLYEKQRDP